MEARQGSQLLGLPLVLNQSGSGKGAAKLLHLRPRDLVQNLAERIKMAGVPGDRDGRPTDSSLQASTALWMGFWLRVEALFVHRTAVVRAEKGVRCGISVRVCVMGRKHNRAGDDVITPGLGLPGSTLVGTCSTLSLGHGLALDP